MDVDYKSIVLCMTAQSIFWMMLQDLGDVVKPGQLYLMNKLYGINGMPMLLLLKVLSRLAILSMLGLAL
jgi:hypothetical protein